MIAVENTMLTHPADTDQAHDPVDLETSSHRGYELGPAEQLRLLTGHVAR